MNVHYDGAVLDIFTAPERGRPMVSRAKTGVMALEGDRYALRDGSFSISKRSPIRHVSLVAIEAITEANDLAGTNFRPELTRRNILTEGIGLNELVDVDFFVGNVLLRGVQLCTPCKLPSIISEIPGFYEAFEGRGGLRAAILSTNPINVNDRIVRK